MKFLEVFVVIAIFVFGLWAAYLSWLLTQAIAATWPQFWMVVPIFWARIVMVTVGTIRKVREQSKRHEEIVTLLRYLVQRSR